MQSSGFEVVGFQLIHQDIMFGIFDMDHNKLQIRQELMRAKDILQHAQDTRQYIGMTINHLLEPGEGIIKKRLKISREGDIFQQNHMNAGRIVPIPPGGGMLASLPVLESVIREDDFPALGSAVTRHVP